MKPGLILGVQFTIITSMRRFLLVALLAAPFAGCLHIDPIQVNADINVNVRVKVDQELSNFFGDLDKQSSTINTPAK